MTHVGCKRAEEMNRYTQLTTTTTPQESTRWALQESTSSTGPVDQPLNSLYDHSRMQYLQKRSYYTHLLPVTMLAIFLLPLQVESWGGGGSSSSSTLDTTYFGNSFTRDWLYNSASISLKVEGCVLGVVEDQSDFGCLEDQSEDGTTNWYMMANCKRPQVAFSVYASDGSSTSCSSANFKESFVTKYGVAEFIHYLATYDSNFQYDNEDGNDYNNLPVCQQGNGGYTGLDCNSDGSFSINYFNDQYCLSRTEKQYNQLKSVNNMMSNYEQCNGAYSYGDNTDYSLVHKLVYYSEPCRSMDSTLCTDNTYFQSRSSGNTGGGGGGSSSGSHRGWSSSSYMGARKSWVTKLKYVVGGLFLLASFIMFTGILFTNRRRRRAMMMRKYRQSKKDKLRDRASGSASKKSSRSGSKSRRSRSKSKKESAEGVFT